MCIRETRKACGCWNNVESFLVPSSLLWSMFYTRLVQKINTFERTGNDTQKNIAACKLTSFQSCIFTGTVLCLSLSSRHGKETVYKIRIYPDFMNPLFRDSWNVTTGWHSFLPSTSGNICG